MKLNLFPSLPAAAGIFLAFAGSAPGQAAKPDADGPKPPVHKPEQSALNRLKQDDRSKKALADTIQQLRETAKRTETADKEIKRVTPNDLKEDPAKAIESLKDKLDPAALKELQEKAKELINSEDGKKLSEELKKKAAANLKPKSAPTTSPPEKFAPSTFDKIPAPTPNTPEVTAKRRTPGFLVDGDSVIFPPTRDPANPDRVLLPSDPRSRTYVVIGNAQVKTASMVLDGDRIEMIASAEGGGINPAPPAAKPAKSKAGDPVKPGIGGAEEEAKKPAPFDRVIATGRVNLVRITNGKTQTGKGGSMIYDKKSGTMILTDWPQAQVEGKVITGKSKDAKIILVPEGEPRVENCRIEGFDAPSAPARIAGGPPAAPAAAAPQPPKAKVVP